MKLLTESDNQIVKLSSLFYKDFTEACFPEILKKGSRPYNCLLFQTHYDYFICIPYRTNINHTNAFIFKNTKRSEENNSGLDYSKIIIIKNLNYIDDSEAIIDRDEYTETYFNLDKIKEEALSYVETYINHISRIKTLSGKIYRRMYFYSTLKYFHKELGIVGTDSLN